MIGDYFKAHRDNVIDLYEGYSKRKQKGDAVDQGFLKQRVENVKENKYKIAVTGEVKSGKSTFINALLKKEILPSDVLQTTSAIVEIFKSEKPVVSVSYADEKTQKRVDGSSFKSFLDFFVKAQIISPSVIIPLRILPSFKIRLPTLFLTIFFAHSSKEMSGEAETKFLVIMSPTFIPILMIKKGNWNL